MNISFERVTILEYRLKAVEAQLKAFRSGEKYVQMEREFQKALRKKDQRIREQDLELSRSHRETISVRNQWFAVFEDMEMEHARELQALRKEKEQLEQKLLKTEKQRDDALDKVTEQRRRIYALETEPVLLPPPPEVLEDPDFKKTSKTIVKQLVNVRMVLDVAEYRADVYYNSQTGERIHAAFPDGIKDDVNYGGSVKAFLFLLNNDCCTSIDKSRKFLSDLTDGKLNISKGMINKLSRESAQKTEQEKRQSIIRSIRKYISEDPWKIRFFHWITTMRNVVSNLSAQENIPGTSSIQQKAPKRVHSYTVLQKVPRQTV